MDLVDKLYQRLLAALDAAGPGAFPDGITVADIYQRLIPFRTVRRQLGVDDLAEYEHALLRLLTSEGRYVELDDPTVKLEIQRELLSLNPIPGIYRDYSTARLRLRLPAPAGATPAAPDNSNYRMSRVDVSAVAVEATSRTSGKSRPDSRLLEAAADATRVVLPGDPRNEATAPPAVPRLSEPAATIHRCDDCARTLPAVAGLRFCPFCGASRPPGSCGRCGGSMEQEWIFCPRCGASGATHGAQV